jgi:hypothetical protein
MDLSIYIYLHINNLKCEFIDKCGNLFSTLCVKVDEPQSNCDTLINLVFAMVDVSQRNESDRLKLNQCLLLHVSCQYFWKQYLLKYHNEEGCNFLSYLILRLVYFGLTTALFHIAEAYE